VLRRYITTACLIPNSNLNNRLVKYKRLIKVIITLSGILLEDKIRRRNNAINAVVDYCNIKEGGVYWPISGKKNLGAENSGSAKPAQVAILAIRDNSQQLANLHK